MPDPEGRVDLRSDTVTRPTDAMRRAMADAEVGDDGFRDDPTVLRLEAEFASLVGKDAAVFVPSGTMANQIALRILAPAGTLAVCGRRQHLVVREHAAAGVNSSAQLLTLDDEDGTLDPAEIARWNADAQVGWAPLSAVFVEDTHGEVGGRVWPIDQLRQIGTLGLPVHLDGARLWNAAVASGLAPAARAASATTVSACLSKGLGAPVGSLLAGPDDLVAAAREERKRLGGMLRQAGVMAAAGLLALQRIDRLVEDHQWAQQLAGAAARRFPGSIDPGAVHTNIVRIEVADPIGVVRHLERQGVRGLPGSATSVRLVTHGDLDDADIARAVGAIESTPDAA